jgi:hypothetical protein
MESGPRFFWEDRGGADTFKAGMVFISSLPHPPREGFRVRAVPGAPPGASCPLSPGNGRSSHDTLGNARLAADVRPGSVGQVNKVLRDIPHGVDTLAFSPDGKRIAVGFGGNPSTSSVYLFDVPVPGQRRP